MSMALFKVQRLEAAAAPVRVTRRSRRPDSEFRRLVDGAGGVSAVARKLGVSREAFTRWEKDPDRIRLRYLKILAGIFNVAVEDLVSTRHDDSFLSRDGRWNAPLLDKILAEQPNNQRRSLAIAFAEYAEYRGWR